MTYLIPMQDYPLRIKKQKSQRDLYMHHPPDELLIGPGCQRALIPPSRDSNSPKSGTLKLQRTICIIYNSLGFGLCLYL